jgi:foldase protein PrsA
MKISKKTKTEKTVNKISLPLIKNFPKANKRNLAILLAIIILAGTLYYFKNQFIVAMVNGKPIFRLTLIRELEKQAGKSILDSLITKTLILDEAKKQNVSISDGEINEEIKKIEENISKQGQELAALLDAQGMTRNDLLEQIKLQKIVEKIAGKDISISEQEVNDYIKTNKDLISKDTDIEKIKETIKGQLEQEKLNEKIQTLVESLRQNAKINYL